MHFLVFRKDACCGLCALTQPLGGGPTTDWVSIQKRKLNGKKEKLYYI